MLTKARLIFLISFIVVFSQTFFPDSVNGANWSRTYGGLSYDSVSSFDRTSDGGYILAGHTENFGAVGHDCSVLKFDNAWKLQWQKIYGGTGSDYCWSIQQTADGGYIAVGDTSSFGAAGSDLWLLKLNSSGNVEWQKRYGGAGNDSGGAVRQTADLGYVVAASTASFGEGGADAWLLKLDSGGNVTWQMSYGGSAADYAIDVQILTGGKYIVAGQTSSFGAGGGDAWLLKLDAEGNVLWQKTYGGTGQDFASRITTAAGGGYIVFGDTSSFGAGGLDLWLLKIDGSGEIAWQKTYGGTGTEESDGSMVRQTSDNGFVLTGATTSFGAPGGDAWLLKLNSSGNVEWQRRYGGSQYDWGWLLDETGDGGYLMFGGTDSFGAGISDIWLLKLKSNGSLPGCPLGEVTNGTVMNSSAAGITSTAGVTITAATVANTTATPSDTTILPNQICPEVLSVLSPNGGEVLATDTNWDISWTPYSPASSFKLSYSLDNGATWELIGRDIIGTSTPWTTPLLAKNKTKCLVKVVGLNNKGVNVGADKSDGNFTIEAVTITYPNGGESFISGIPETVTWVNNVTGATTARLFYTLDNGLTWQKVPEDIDLSVNPSSYSWTPVVSKEKGKCRMKIVLKDAVGTKVGSDVSDGTFRITTP